MKQLQAIFSNRTWTLVFLGVCLATLLFAWTRYPLSQYHIDRDWGRDLKEISNIYKGDLVWLGPWLDPGLHASSSYYYFFFPAMVIGQGSPLAMVWFNLELFLVGMIVLAWVWRRHFNWWAGVGIIIMGVSPWVLEAVVHPGNGFTYIVLVLLGVASLYYRWPLVISAALVGLATSFHPGGFLVLPLLVYEFWQRRKHWREVIISLFVFMIPWLPLIGYEVITKGFIIRTFLSHPSSGSLSFYLSWSAIDLTAALVVLPRNVFMFSLVIVGLIVRYSYRRLWPLVMILLGWLVIFSFVSGLTSRYVYPLAILFQFIVIVLLLRLRRGKFLLAIYAAMVLFLAPSYQPGYISVGDHNSVKVIQVAEGFMSSFANFKPYSLALVTAEVKDQYDPQADDYRAYLRFHGFNVVDVTQNNTADFLVMFIEAPNFDWNNWSTWEINQFGDKRLYWFGRMKNADIAVFTRTNELPTLQY